MSVLYLIYIYILCCIFTSRLVDTKRSKSKKSSKLLFAQLFGSPIGTLVAPVLDSPEIVTGIIDVYRDADFTDEIVFFNLDHIGSHNVGPLKLRNSTNIHTLRVLVYVSA